jgi:hypothetical protein
MCNLVTVLLRDVSGLQDCSKNALPFGVAASSTFAAAVIERFYNPSRRHSTIGYLSPMQFEHKTRLA